MIRRLLAVLGLVLAFVATEASAQSLTTYTYATLPGSPTGGQLAWITDNSGSPTVGSPAAGGAAAGNRDLVAYDATQTRWEFVQRQPTAGSGTPLQSYMEAQRVAVSNVISGVLVPNLQTALDMLFSYGRSFVSYFTARDADGDGLFEWSMLRDFDGDGSFIVTCTAKDVAGAIAEPACKVAGERVYRDIADDLNCGMHGCGFGQMELTGLIELDANVVYVNFPCWEPTNTRNPSTATTAAAHDTTGDSAWTTDCPASPDPNTTRKLGTIATLGWQGTIQGAGTDTRNPATTTGYKRDRGTYIVNDMGPTWFPDTAYVGAQEGLNPWWGQPGHVRGVNFGFSEGFNASTSSFVNSGEFVGDFDSTGHGTTSGNQAINSMDSTICVVDDAGLASLVAGDVITVESTPDATGTGVYSVAAIRVRDVPTVSNCDAGHSGNELSIPLGGRVLTSSGVPGTNANYYGADLPYTLRAHAGGLVTAVRSDFLSSSARLTKVTLEPQDWWGEPGGDCSVTLTNGPWTYALDASEADFDCDTNPLIGIWGGGADVVEDVVLRHWHSYGIDGTSNAGNPLISRARFLYGKGFPIMDWGTGWNIRDLEVRNSEFSSYVVSTFGPGVLFDGLKVYNSTAEGVFLFAASNAVGNVIRNVFVENSVVRRMVALGCGARFNIFENFGMENAYGLGTTALNNGYLAYLSCPTVGGVPIEQNVFRNFRLTGVNPNGGFSMAAVILDTGATIASPKSANISGNSFDGFVMKMTESNAAYEACLFASLDSDATGAPNDRTGLTPDDYSHEDVLALNTFSNSSVINTGGGADWVYCGCNVNAGGTPPGQQTCVATVGSGSGIGADARGCLNVDKNAKPSFETCS